MDATYANEQHPAAHLHAVCGLEALRVTVSNDDTDFGMSHRDLTNFVHGMLRLAGVPVVPADDPDAPTLHTAVAARKVVDLYSVSLSVELWDRVWLTRQTHGHSLHAATWRHASSLVSNRHELRDNIRMELGNLLTTFLNDYIAANQPNRASA